MFDDWVRLQGTSLQGQGPSAGAYAGEVRITLANEIGLAE